jgi:UDPglucose--hexose-1-phosphate uridylyltransferase
MAVRPDGSPPNGPGWKVRVVPNKFPALRLDERLEVTGYGNYDMVRGFGAHEVVIESARHVTSPVEMPAEDFALVVRTCAERSRALSADERLAYVIIFKNVGQTAGASIEHSHSQLIAVPVMPKRVQEEMASCREYFGERERCLFCDIIERELRLGERVVLESDDFVVLTPFASRFPFEMWMLPKVHAGRFFEMDSRCCLNAARTLQEVLGRLDICLQQPPYNYVIHTAPAAGRDAASYHWHIEIIPRVTQVAGFEWGTGFYINPMPPEHAARYLREVPEARLRAVLASVPIGRAAGG